MIKTNKKKLSKLKRPQKTKEEIIEEYKQRIHDWDRYNLEDKEFCLALLRKVEIFVANYEQLDIPLEFLVDELDELIYGPRCELVSTEPRRLPKTREELIEECKQRIHDWDSLNDERKEIHLALALDWDHNEAYCEHPGVPCVCCGKEYDEYGDDWSHKIASNGNILKICDNCFQKLNDEKELTVTDFSSLPSRIHTHSL